ncbi:LacI family DNA-binding transcriptional regulator [Devosia nitrariae]|uniref:LacI family transcriptional regulator n=1 Tax=Devosia nitrariae TaxID=2071872 RepID=A0ABQ5W4R5_9HYPH|nr:LacI family DNA-binding transcriptional regulator [Devosia nitrariae]GLQ54843.1 LacI family transcriptional regulator [Devosia nitrariae]
MTIVNRRPNQADIAARLGVSVSTVSRALANEVGISETVRRDVHKMAQALGYKSKHVSVAAAGRRAVALVPLGSATGGISNFYFGIIEAMRRTAEEMGLALDLRLVGDATVSLETVRRHLAQAEANGVLLAGIDPVDEVADWCAENAVAIVLVNGVDPRMRVSSVAPSNFYGAYLATKRLLDAGHRRILHYTHLFRPTIVQRRRGFEAAIAETPEAEGIVVTSDEQTRAELFESIVTNRYGATALFNWNDIAAVEILEGAQDGTPLPADFSIIGFDDLPVAAIATPRLATMRVDREAIGAGAIRLLVQQMSGVTAVQQLQIGVTPVQGGTIFPLNR